jgi:hypothetical protein
MKRAFWGGTVAGRLAAAGLEFIDGSFEELAEGQEVIEALLAAPRAGVWRPAGEMRQEPAAPGLAGFQRPLPDRSPCGLPEG